MNNLSIWRQGFIDGFKEQPLRFSSISSLLVAALITPPDLFTQVQVGIIIFVPMYLIIKLNNK